MADRRPNLRDMLPSVTMVCRSAGGSGGIFGIVPQAKVCTGSCCEVAGLQQRGVCGAVAAELHVGHAQYL